MELIMDFCRDYGYWGMCFISFLSGSILPFSSDVLLVFFLGVGLNPLHLLISSTIGNTLGGMTCYFLGGFIKKGWFTRFFRVKGEKAERANAYIEKYGYWAAFFSFLAVVGEAIVIMLGNMRVCWWKVFLVMILGKILRYLIIILSFEGVATAVA